MLEKNLELRSKYRRTAHRLWINNEPAKAWKAAYKIKNEVLAIEKNESKKFYKYKSFFDWDEQRLLSELEDIELNQICLMDPSKFNDPYDCLVPPEVVKELHKTRASDPANFFMAKSVIREVQKDNPLAKIHLGTKDQKAKLANYLVQSKKSLDPEQLEESAKNMRSNLAISCFSISPFEMYFWSHYGGCHKGYCVEYEFSSEIFNKYLHPVEYTEEWPVKNFKTKYKGAHASLALIKSKKDWSAEHEWRFVMSDKDPEQLLLKKSVPDVKISAIYLGLDFFKDKSDIAAKRWEQILTICTNNSVRIIPVVLKNNGFGIDHGKDLMNNK